MSAAQRAGARRFWTPEAKRPERSRVCGHGTQRNPLGPGDTISTCAMCAWRIAYGSWRIVYTWLPSDLVGLPTGNGFDLGHICQALEHFERAILDQRRHAFLLCTRC